MKNTKFAHYQVARIWIWYVVRHQHLYFTPKMCQNCWRPGLQPGPHWETYDAPRPPKHLGKPFQPSEPKHVDWCIPPQWFSHQIPRTSLPNALRHETAVWQLARCHLIAVDRPYTGSYGVNEAQDDLPSQPLIRFFAAVLAFKIAMRRQLSIKLLGPWLL